MTETPLVQSVNYSQQQLKLLNPKNYKSIIELFSDSCRLYRDKPAFTCLEHTLSFDDVDIMSRNFAAYFLTKQIGSRVTALLFNYLIWLNTPLYMASITSRFNSSYTINLKGQIK
jgi:long-chain acyl-CoA synthetase